MKQQHTVITFLAFFVTAILSLLSTCDALSASNDNPQRSEQQLIAVLQSDAQLFEKARACRQLSVIGGEKAVPVLAALLGDESLSDYARFALEPIEEPSVDEALRKSMGKLKGRLLAGVIGSIGVRRDAKAVSDLSRLVRDPSSGVASEALAALGQISTDEAINTILQALSTGSASLRSAAADACLASAERQLAGNKPKEAVKLYDTVRKADVPKHIRAAAVYGAILARGTEGLPLLIEQLRTNKPAMVEIALLAARKLPSPKVTEALVAELEKSQPIVQVLLIKVLVDRKDRSARESIEALAASDNPKVRSESLKVLGQIGDATAVPVLLKAAGNEGTEAAIALAGLRMLKCDGVDKAIIEGMKSTKAPLRADLIDVLTGRGYRSAIQVFFEQARNENPTVAKAALRGLGSMSSCQGLSKVIDLLIETSDESVREQALRTVIAITRRSIPRFETELRSLIIRRLNKVDSIPARCTLMRALLVVPSEDSLKWLQNASNDTNTRVADAAVRTIADYPDPAAAEILLNILKTSQDKAHRIIALRGCIRLCKTTNIPVQSAIKLYQQVMKQSDTPAKRKLVLSGLAEVAHPDALRMALSVMEQPAVKAEASLAVIALAQKTSAMDASLASTAAGKVLADPTLNNLHPRARSVIDMIKSFEDFILAWQVTGPYFKDNSNHSELFAVAFAPETISADVKWSPIPAGTDPKRPWILDLLKLYPGNSRVSYVKTSIKSPRKQQVILELGSDDGNKAWLNGKLVHANNIARAAIPGSDKAKITLNEGWNKLMLKITQNVGPWEFCARIRNADGAKVEGIEIDCFHEGPLLVHEEGKQSKAGPIFDGKTFAGWDGNLDIFRIEDEAIVGGTLKERIKRNEFLCAEKEYDNFELSLKVKLLGKNANAGIQIRSRRVPNHNEMIGYQADMGQHYWGCLYDESRRRKVLASANRPELDKVLKLDGWNDYIVRCEGKRIRLWINGYQTVDYTEGDDSIEQTGLIGLQIHGGGPSEAWYKDIRIVEFP